jgi:hypothetical protein
MPDIPSKPSSSRCLQDDGPFAPHARGPSSPALALPRHPTPHVIVRADGPIWRVSVDGVHRSQHLTEAKALQRGRELARANGAELLIVSPSTGQDNQTW